MDLKKELSINEKQPLYGCKGTYTGDFFQALIDECNKHIGGAARNPHYLMSQSFSYGIIQGKRSERARRKGEAFQIDMESPRSESEKLIIELLSVLWELEVDELERVHATWLEEATRGGAGDREKWFIDRVTEAVISEKRKALNHPDN